MNCENDATDACSATACCSHDSAEASALSRTAASISARVNELDDAGVIANGSAVADGCAVASTLATIDSPSLVTNGRPGS